MWSQKKAANRYYKRLITGQTKRTNISPQKYKEFLTDKQYQQILRIINGENPINPDKYTLDYVKDILLNNPNENITLSTKIKHKNTIGGIFNLFDADNLIEVIDTDKQELVEKITEKFKSSGTQITILILLIEHLLPELKQYYMHLLDYLKDEKKQTASKQAVADYDNRTKDNTDYSAEYEKLLKIRAKYTDYSTEHLLALLYTDGIFNNKGVLTVVPRGYFINVKIADADEINDVENFYIPKSARLVINSFKTSKKFKYDYILPKNIKDAINTSLTLSPRKWLIADNNGNPFKLTTYWKITKNAIGVGNQDYRKIIENSFLQSGYDAVKLSNAMGHSINTQRKQYVATN